MMNGVNATPHAELIVELMNPNNPKNEREHAAVREIERLQEALAQPEQYDQTALELCKKCGWKAVWPDGCLVCEKQEASVPHELEPVAWMHIHGNHEDPCFCEITEDEISQGWTQKPLYYTAPPQREWVGLTDEDLVDCETEFDVAFAHDIEAKIKEKNT